MFFQQDQLYHVYNRGNNKQKIFFNRENYLYFLRKVRKGFIPYCDILSYCLMPNHFHFLIFTKGKHPSDDWLAFGKAASDGYAGRMPADPSDGSNPHSIQPSDGQQLNKAIGVLLSSYAQAINLQEKRT